MSSDALYFRERMKGWVSFDIHSYNEAVHSGRRLGQTCAHDLTIHIADLDRFVDEPDHAAAITGSVTCDALGGKLTVCPGSTFNLFVPAPGDPVDPRHKRMLYRLLLRDRAGRKLTLSGFKDLQRGPNLDAWQDTTRLFVRILTGHRTEDPPDNAATVATGILYIGHFRLLQMGASFRADGSTRWQRLRRTLGGSAWFAAFFAWNLFELYLARATVTNDSDFPMPTGLDPRWHGQTTPAEWHPVPWHPGLERQIIGFTAGDGLPLTLHRLRLTARPQRKPRGPVLLIHGAGVRANLFYGSPRQPTLAVTLLERGYDVWLENWRASIDLPATSWTLDHAAMYDHPRAIAKVLELTEYRTLGAVIHCQGSTSFTMAAIADLVPEVTTVVSNAVSLHIHPPLTSKLKTWCLAPIVGLRLRGLDAQWAVRPPSTLAKAMAVTAKLIRGRDCDNDVCQMANYMYGVGGDLLWRHANLDAATHEWVSREFGFTPITFFKQIGEADRAGYLVPALYRVGWLNSLVEPGRPTKWARWTFMVGSENRIFLPAGQRESHAYFEERFPGKNAFHLLPGFAHLDVFFGRQAAEEVFPIIVGALDADVFLPA